MMASCQSQKRVVKPDNKVEQSNDNLKTDLLGSWKLIERKYADGVEKKIYPLHQCEKEYTLVFEKVSGNTLLTKNYATGKNCQIKSSSGPLSVSISESSFSYLDVDLKRTERYKISSPKKLSIFYNEILYGKARQIEDLYERLEKR
jgi:hypothetical protein